MNAEREREIKLLDSHGHDPAAIVEAIRALGFAVDVHAVRLQRDVYLDSPRLDFARAGAGLRWRSAEGVSLICWKGPGIVDEDVMTRLEVEAPWPSSRLPEASSELPAALRAHAQPLALARPLAEIAVVTCERHAFTVVSADGDARAELAVDAVTGHVSGHAVAFHEIELEIEEGDAEPFIALGQQLRARFELEPSTISKLERTRELAGVDPVDPSPAAPLDLDMPFQDAALAVFRHHLASVLEEEPGTRLRTHIERLHKMRVATRRLRASFRTFRGAFTLDALAPWDALMRRTGRALGPARDLDVLLDTLPALGASLPEDVAHEIGPFAELVHALRDAEQERLLRWLESRARLRGFERFQHFVETGPRPGERLALPLRDVAPGLVLGAARKVYRRGAKIRDDSPPEKLHALRIAMKRLRYTLESFADAYGKPLRSFIDDTKALQDVLGAFNDTVVHAALIRELVERKGKHLPRSAVLASGALVGVLVARGEEARSHFEEIFGEFARGEVRQRLEEAVNGRW